MGSTPTKPWFRRAEDLTTPQRELVYELIRRGEWDILFHPGQRKLFNQWKDFDNQIFVMNVSRQWGKSRFMATVACIEAITKPKENIILGAPTIDWARDIVKPRMDEIIAFLPPEYRPKQTGEFWNFNNGSKVKISGANHGKGKRVRGQAVSLAMLDECRDMPALYEIINEAIMPSFTTTQGKLILGSTPPDSPSHPFTSIYIKKAIEEGSYFHQTYKDNPLLDETWFNKSIIPEYKDPFNNDKFRREYLADYTCVAQDLKVIPEWDSNQNDTFFNEWTRPNIKMPHYVGIDVGQVDFTSIVFADYDWLNGRLVVLDEITLKAPNTNPIALAIKQKEIELWGTNDNHAITRVSDTDLRLINDFREDHGLFVNPVRKLTREAMINRLRVNIQDQKIIINPNTCPNLIWQLATGVWNQNKTDFVRTFEGGHLDSLDALKYLNLIVDWTEVLRDPIDPYRTNGQIINPNAVMKQNKDESWSFGKALSSF